jgi:hypothetical protein
MPPDFKREAAEISDRLNLMNILFYVRIGDQFNLSVIESNPGKSNGGGNISGTSLARDRHS